MSAQTRKARKGTFVCHLGLNRSNDSFGTDTPVLLFSTLLPILSDFLKAAWKQSLCEAVIWGPFSENILYRMLLSFPGEVNDPICSPQTQQSMICSKAPRRQRSHLSDNLAHCCASSSPGWRLLLAPKGCPRRGACGVGFQQGSASEELPSPPGPLEGACGSWGQ